jgi:cupin fold WbuC family metalloprotein
MGPQIFSHFYLESLTADAKKAGRLRKHNNIHDSYNESCQRLMNAISVGSYIAPHRHHLDPKNECLIAVRGVFAAIIFDNTGEINCIEYFGTEKFENLSVGLELRSQSWHTVLALEEGSIIFEVKEGPFQPAAGKEYAPWAPGEDSVEAKAYYAHLMLECRREFEKKNA